jgi:hypothetical protein
VEALIEQFGSLPGVTAVAASRMDRMRALRSE